MLGCVYVAGLHAPGNEACKLRASCVGPRTDNILSLFESDLNRWSWQKLQQRGSFSTMKYYIGLDIVPAQQLCWCGASSVWPAAGKHKTIQEVFQHYYSVRRYNAALVNWRFIHPQISWQQQCQATGNRNDKPLESSHTSIMSSSSTSDHFLTGVYGKQVFTILLILFFFVLIIDLCILDAKLQHVTPDLVDYSCWLLSLDS